ncbi:hypothetical protein DFH08DRAFT_940099 [Mycena albidolilacea]|uniref:Uncharacterized protein n=1 Tax=Mycena albidolilacea TaxID=1033008 RepID=A0AAD7EKD4_9AGAR|nr:hypothetical protein DFH08DRAFT_940099 [Mycena albidolilacea]
MGLENKPDVDFLHKMSLRFAPGCRSRRKNRVTNFVAGEIMAVQGLRKRDGKRVPPVVQFRREIGATTEFSRWRGGFIQIRVLHQDVSSGDWSGGKIHGPGLGEEERTTRGSKSKRERLRDPGLTLGRGGVGHGRNDSIPNEKRAAFIYKEFCWNNWFVGNQKAVLEIIEGSGWMGLDREDEQRNAKEDRLYGERSNRESRAIELGNPPVRVSGYCVLPGGTFLGREHHVPTPCGPCGALRNTERYLAGIVGEYVESPQGRERKRNQDLLSKVLKKATCVASKFDVSRLDGLNLCCLPQSAVVPAVLEPPEIKTVGETAH